MKINVAEVNSNRQKFYHNKITIATVITEQLNILPKDNSIYYTKLFEDVIFLGLISWNINVENQRSGSGGGEKIQNIFWGMRYHHVM